MQKQALNISEPYGNLSPEMVLNAVESLGFECTGNFFTLNSYENRVYDVGIEDHENVIVKFYRPFRWSKDQLLEEHRFALQLEEHEVPVVAPMEIDGETIFEYEGYLFSLYPKRGGRSIELKTEEDFRHMGRLIARIHTVGSWDHYSHRPALTVKSMGWDNLVHLRKSGHIPADMLTNYDVTVTNILTHLDAIWGDRQFNLRLHGDAHLGNILDNGDIFFVDLDDSMSGPAVQDLWLFVNGDRAEMAKQFGLLLEGYTQIRDFDYSELQLVEALRTLRMIHYTAWISKRWEDKAFPRSFPFFQDIDFWNRHLLDLKEQMANLHEPLFVQI
ncbi:MAG: serine/threonine protein kinase [Magnetococcales bacterium]|nr:serine/threonine protein kinase [Magnetococcales bacterium]|tara:strand:- start:3720 stop:4709 length:990 start_codon:yes stop_codon:yes gene_type:complete